MSSCVGVILAGGEGKRLGRTKGDLSFDGRALADRAASEIWAFCPTVLIATGNIAENPAPRFVAVPDLPPAGRGPLAGIEAAFAASGDADLFVLACDYPRVGSALVRQILSLAEATDAAVIFPTDSHGRDHPLVGVWRRRAEPVIREALAGGAFAVRGLLAELEVERLRPASFPGTDLGPALLNLNWPKDWELLTGGQAR